MKNHIIPQPPKRPRQESEHAQLSDAIGKIANALEPFSQGEQKRLLKAACVLCELDADINEPSP